MRKLLYAIILCFLSFQLPLFLIPETTAQGIPNVWVADNTLVSGLADVGDYSTPAIAFNVTGDGKWVLISGRALGTFVGYYWNGSQWIADSSLVTGLGNVGGGTLGVWNMSSPTIGFNVTGDGKWVLISGRYKGDFVGYYWNGSQWVLDSSYVSGLADIGEDSVACLIFNLKVDDKWVFLAGEDAATFKGYYWDTTQWVNDDSLVSDLALITNEGCRGITAGYNLLGNDKWVLIIGGSTYHSYGFIWVDSWTYEGLVVANWIWLDDAVAVTPSLVQNLLGTNEWTLIIGADTGNFYGLKYKSSILNSLVEIDRSFLSPHSGEVYAIAYASGYLYLGFNTAPAKIFKLESQTMNLVSNLTLDTDENYVEIKGMIVSGSYLYVGLFTNPAKIVKINLDDFTKVTTLTLDTGETYCNALVTDGTFLYCATNNAYLVKINQTSMQRIGRITLGVTTYSLEIKNGYVYAGLGWLTGQNVRVQKIDLSTFSINATLTIDTIQIGVESMVSDDSWLYVGYEYYIRRVNLTTFSNDVRLSATAYNADMVIIGENLFYLDAVAIKQVYLPTFSMGTSCSLIETAYDTTTDGNFIYTPSITDPATTHKNYLAGTTLYPVTVSGNPEIIIPFTLDGYTYTTPCFINLPSGDHTLAIINIFMEVDGFLLVFDNWTINGQDFLGEQKTVTIASATSITINYLVGTLNMLFEDDFETGDLSKQDGIITQTKEGSSAQCIASEDAHYTGSYGLESTAQAFHFSSVYAFVLKTRFSSEYLYLNFSVNVPSGCQDGWFALLGGTPLDGYPPKRIHFGIGWKSTKFQILQYYYGAQLVYDFSGFQHDTWYNVTIFIRRHSARGFYAVWVDGILRWYKLNQNTIMDYGVASTVLLGIWHYTQYITHSSYIDDEKVYDYTDPAFPIYYTIQITADPLETATFAFNGISYRTPCTLIAQAGTYQLSIVDIFLEVNQTKYAFSYWLISGSQTKRYDSVTSINVNSDLNITINYFVGAFRKPSSPNPLPSPAISEPSCLLLFIILLLLALLSVYLKTQKALWLAGIPMLLFGLYLILVDPMCPLYGFYVGIGLILFGVALILYKLVKMRK